MWVYRWMGGRRREGVRRKEEEEVSVSHVSVKLPLLSFLCKMNHVAWAPMTRTSSYLDNMCTT